MMSVLRGTRVLVALLFVFLVTCMDGRDSLAPEIEPDPIPEAPPSDMAIPCTAVVTDPAVRCASPRTGAGGLDPASLIVGGQGTFVQLAPDNVAYDEVGELFTFDVTVRNLIGQALGTSDGITVDGIQVFFHAPPVATGGTGTITVMGDGVGTFTGANQPYYAYAQILPPLTPSAARGWTLGVEIPGASVTWSIDDEDVATVSATGLVTAVALGPVTITADGDNVSGATTMTVVTPCSVKPEVTMGPVVMHEDVPKFVQIEGTAGPDCGFHARGGSGPS
jgi:hypothetical protein